MPLINIQNLEMSFGEHPLFNKSNLSIEQGEKISLIGRNGTGKSTLLKLIGEKIQPDSGSISTLKGIRITSLSQEVPNDIRGNAFDVVASGLGKNSDLIAQYHDVSQRLSEENTPALIEELNEIHDLLEAEGGWEVQHQVDKIISQLGLDPALVFKSASAGQKRKILLGKALAGQPDVLLLDEPTNHMDIESIRKLEEFLIWFPGTLIFVTHDRMFLRKVANRIVEIDRGNLFSQSCNYDTFLVRRQAARDAEISENALFDKKLAKEEQWIRQGIKARRTRNEGRVKALKKMREERRVRRKQTGLVKMKLQEAKRSGKIVAEAENVTFRYSKNTIISNLSTTIVKGDRVGILGSNGVGKSTLINLLLGKLQPVSGKIKIGTMLQISYFDQMRELLDEKKTVRENVNDGNDMVTVNGRNRHVIGYLEDFLFSPAMAMATVSKLSGGERNRLLLAKLFTRPSNLLVLDEPTNDLDVETLELLEDILLQYNGTILLVSHDRAFINNVVTSTIVFEGDGVVKEYVGGFDDWIRQRSEKEKEKKVKIEKNKTQSKANPAKKQKLGYKQQRELDSIPQEIELLETKQEELCNVINGSGFYKKDKAEILAVNKELESIKDKLKKIYIRWEELDRLVQN